jgi:hypothetical protein
MTAEWIGMVAFQLKLLGMGEQTEYEGEFEFD